MNLFGMLADVYAGVGQVIAPGLAIKRLEKALLDPAKTAEDKQVLRGKIMGLLANQKRDDEAKRYYDEIAQHASALNWKGHPEREVAVLVSCASVELRTLKDEPKARATALRAQALAKRVLDSVPVLAHEPKDRHADLLRADHASKEMARINLALLEIDFPKLSGK